MLELCLRISGGFESGGGASYTAVTGNFDGMGLSCGVLQWCAGQGSLQTLVKAIGASMGWDKAKSFFSSDIQQFSQLGPAAAIQWCLDKYIVSGGTAVSRGRRRAGRYSSGSPSPWRRRCS